jgi:NADPH:quinone reductase-like Zn-dependent oxidoreductase
MKAALLLGFGGVDQIEVRDVPEPNLGADEIKVRAVATSINPIDWKLREGAKRPGMPLELPAILGRDCAGEVVELGAGVTRFRVGDRVAGLVMGGYAERVVAKEDAWAEVPASIDLIDAASVPLVALTGAELVDEGVNPRAGEVVLVTGAVGSVGRAAVFTAKMRGAKVWAGVRSSQQNAAMVLGVEGVVVLDADKLDDSTPTFDAIADTIGGAPMQRLVERVRTGGTIATVVGEPPNAKDRGLVVKQMWAHPDHERLATLLRAVADGTLVIPIAMRFTLSQIRDAQEAAQHGASGKVVVRIS